jgi:predicted PurR-regulated permease PerM
MTEQKVEVGTGGFGPRERRWLIVFLALGSIYFGLLLADRLIGVLSGFASILLILFLAWLLAFVLSPLVAWLEDRLSAPRAAVVIGVYVLMLVIIGFALFYTGAAITQQVGELARSYPDTRDAIAGPGGVLDEWEESLELGRLRIDLTDLYAGAEAQVGVFGRQIVDQAEAIARVTIAALGSLLLIIFLSLYMLMDSRRILPRLRSAVPRKYRDESDLFERTTVRAFGGFLRAQLILAVVQGLLVALVGTIFGIPYLFLWATTSALLMLIPFFGPPLALIPPIVGAALFAGGSVLPVAIILLVAQTLIVNWLQPRLMRDALGLHPILVLVGLLVGAQVAGIWGALFGIPVIAVIWVFVSYALFGTVPNAALPAEERPTDVDEHVMVSVAKEQVGDETHPHIRVTRSRGADGSEQVDIQTDPVRDPNA